MPNWQPSDLAAYQARRAPSRAKPEPIVRNEPVAKEARKDEHAGRIRIRVTSFRVRFCDPDNLCAKYFIDCLRYAQIIPNDREEDIELTVRQTKVALKSDERTEIEIE